MTQCSIQWLDFLVGLLTLVLNEFEDKSKLKLHYSNSQIFVQKFNFDKTPTFSRVFHQNFFDNFSREIREIKVANS